MHAALTHTVEKAVCEIEGKQALVMGNLAETAVKELFRWVSQFLTLKEPRLLNEYIDRLEFPPVGPDEPYWDGSEEIITL